MQTNRCGNIHRQKWSRKETEYKRLWKEIKRMCNRKCKIIPVMIRASRRGTKILRKNWKVVPLWCKISWKHISEVNMGEAKCKSFFPGNQSAGLVQRCFFCPLDSYKELMSYVTEHQSTSKLGYKEDLDHDWIKINACSIRQLNKT